jgi:sugar transferase (PEP-CTERM/EpsH1 system associated)
VRAVTAPALIAHVIYKLDVGGLENGLVNLVNRLPADRFRHAIVCLTGHTSFRERIGRADTQLISIEKRPGKDPAAYLRFHRILRGLRPRILHTRNLGTIDMQWIGFTAGVPARVHGEHGWTADDPQGMDRRNLQIRRACRPVIHRWLGMSQDIERWLADDVRVPKDRIRQLYNGVQADRFTPNGLLPADLPWSPSADSVTIGTVGRLDPVKNQASLISAVHRILERRPHLRSRLKLIMAGDGPLRTDLERMIERLGIARSVWLPGGRADVPALLRAMDIFALPSLNEGISNTVLEAMATGRPVVATSVGGNPELVVKGQTGVLYAGDVPTELDEALLGYVDDPAKRAEHGRAGRVRVLERFSLDSMVAKYAEFYEEMLVVGG